MNHRDGVRFQQGHEAFFEVDVLAGADGGQHRLLEPQPLIGQLPGDHVFVPGQAEGVERLTQADAGLDIDSAEVIRRQWDFITDDVADLADVFDEDVDAELGDLDASEGVHTFGNWAAFGGAETAPSMPLSKPMPISILRNLKPASMRCFRRRPISVPSGTESVSQ